jgi:hypothetical protein
MERSTSTIPPVLARQSILRGADYLSPDRQINLVLGLKCDARAIEIGRKLEAGPGRLLSFKRVSPGIEMGQPAQRILRGVDVKFDEFPAEAAPLQQSRIAPAWI